MHTQERQDLDSSSDAIQFPRPKAAKLSKQTDRALGSSLLCRMPERWLLSPHILGVSWGHWGCFFS